MYFTPADWNNSKTYESQKPPDTWFGCFTFFCFMFAMKGKQNMEEVPYSC